MTSTGRNLWNTKLFTNNEHTLSFPTSKATVILRDDVTNRNMLKNPYNTKNESPPIGGLRPTIIGADKLGNVFARSKVGLVEGVTNINMLQNPYNTLSDPVLEPRVITMQLIKDINNKKLPKYITENKGVGEMAYRLLSAMMNNGVKLITIEMLRSYISGKKFTTILDPGGQKVGRAIAYYEQLLSDAKKLQKLGQLDSNIKLINDKYTKGLVSVFGETILQPVEYTQINEAMKQLALMSGVLSRLFNQQNALEPSNLVPFEVLMGLEKNTNFFLEKKEALPSAPRIEVPDVTEIPLEPVQEHPTQTPMEAPIAEVPIQAQEGLAPPVIEKEAKSNIIRNALIAGGLTAAAIGIAYFYGQRIENQRIVALGGPAPFPHGGPPPVLAVAMPVVPAAVAGALAGAAGQPPAVNAVGVGAAVAGAQQAVNVLNAVAGNIADQVPHQVDIDGGVAKAVMRGDEEKDDPDLSRIVIEHRAKSIVDERIAARKAARKAAREWKQNKAVEFDKNRLKKLIFGLVKQYNTSPKVREQKNIVSGIVQFAAAQENVKLRNDEKKAAEDIIDNIFRSVQSDSEKAKQISQVVSDLGASNPVSAAAEQPQSIDDINPIALYATIDPKIKEKLTFTKFSELLHGYHEQGLAETTPFDEYLRRETFMLTATKKSTAIPEQARALFTKEEITDFRQEYALLPDPKGSFTEYLMQQLNIRYPSAPPTVVAPTVAGDVLPSEYIDAVGEFNGSFIGIAPLIKFGTTSEEIEKLIDDNIMSLYTSAAGRKGMYEKLALSYASNYVLKYDNLLVRAAEKDKLLRDLSINPNTGDAKLDLRTNEDKARFNAKFSMMLKDDIKRNIIPNIKPVAKSVTGNGRKSTKKTMTKVPVVNKNIDDEIMRILSRR